MSCSPIDNAHRLLGEALIELFGKKGKAGLIKSGQKHSKDFTPEGSNGHKQMNTFIPNVNGGFGTMALGSPLAFQLGSGAYPHLILKIEVFLGISLG
jgi:hypothetical protein